MFVLYYSFVVQDSAIWRQLAGICCARVFGAHARRNGSASSMCAHVRAQFPSLESYDGYFDCFASFVSIISQYSFVVRRRIVHCSGNLRLAARVFFARMCAFSMCAHVSLRAHRRRAFASRASFQAWNPHCLASFGSIVRLIYYIYISIYLFIFVRILCLYYTIALWCKILQFGGSLLGSAARVFLARMRAGMAERPDPHYLTNV